MLYTLNLYRDVGQLYLNKTEKKYKSDDDSVVFEGQCLRSVALSPTTNFSIIPQNAWDFNTMDSPSERNSFRTKITFWGWGGGGGE